MPGKEVFQDKVVFTAALQILTLALLLSRAFICFIKSAAFGLNF